MPALYYIKTARRSVLCQCYNAPVLHYINIKTARRSTLCQYCIAMHPFYTNVIMHCCHTYSLQPEALPLLHRGCCDAGAAPFCNARAAPAVPGRCCTGAAAMRARPQCAQATAGLGTSPPLPGGGIVTITRRSRGVAWRLVFNAMGVVVNAAARQQPTLI